MQCSSLFGSGSWGGAALLSSLQLFMGARFLRVPAPMQARGRYTPVPYFLAGEALLGTDSGRVLGCSPGADGSRSGWRELLRLPAPVLCFASAGQSPSSVMH